MTGTQHIEIHTIFSANEAGRSGLRLRVVGLVTFVVAVAWLCCVWWPVYTKVQMPLMIGKMNVDMEFRSSAGQNAPADDLAAFSEIISGNAVAATPVPDAGDESPQADASTADSGDQASEDSSDADDTPSLARRKSKHDRANVVLVFAAVSWLGVPSFVGAWLAMSGCAALLSSRKSRVLGRLAAPLVVLGASGLAWYVWREYGWYESILPDWVKPVFLGLLITLAASCGAALNRHGVGLSRAGAWLVIISAVLTTAAIWASVHFHAMPSEGVDAALYAKVFGLQSAYGWILLLSLLRL